MDFRMLKILYKSKFIIVNIIKREKEVESITKK